MWAALAASALLHSLLLAGASIWWKRSMPDPTMGTELVIDLVQAKPGPTMPRALPAPSHPRHLTPPSTTPAAPAGRVTTPAAALPAQPAATAHPSAERRSGDPEPPPSDATAAASKPLAAPDVPRRAAVPPLPDTRLERAQRAILAWLAQHRRYPRAARRAGLEGTVHVRFELDAGGRLLVSAVERSSGHTSLDRAALDLLDRAAPFPLPALAEVDRIEMRIPIVFRLPQDFAATDAP